MKLPRAIGFVTMFLGIALTFFSNRITGAVTGSQYAQAIGGVAIMLFVVGLIIVAKSHQNENCNHNDPKLRYIVGDKFDRKIAKKRGDDDED